MTNGKKYNLTERTYNFGKSVIVFAKTLPKNTITLPLIPQFIRAGTSVGANYSEADNAESKNDFKHKIGIAKKEAQETVYWLDLVITACPELKELNLIFNAIIRSCSERLDIRN